MLLSAPVVEWISKAPEIAHSIQDKFALLDRAACRACAICARLSFPSQRRQSSVNVDFWSPSRRARRRLSRRRLAKIVTLFCRAVLFPAGPPQRCASRAGWLFSMNSKRGCARLKILNDFEHNLTGYLSVVALINFGVGICAGRDRLAGRAAGSDRLGRARLRPQFHALYSARGFIGNWHVPGRAW